MHHSVQTNAANALVDHQCEGALSEIDCSNLQSTAVNREIWPMNKFTLLLNILFLYLKGSPVIKVAVAVPKLYLTNLANLLEYFREI